MRHSVFKQATASLAVLALVLSGCPAGQGAGEPDPAPSFRVVDDPPEPTASTEDEVTQLRGEPIDIVPSAEVGTLPGSSRVDRFGQAHYTIPLEVAPGPRGMQPRPALVYSSGGRNGNLGMGFALAGQSRISRCPRSLRMDDGYAPVQFESDDALCLDGERLILHAGSYGQAGSEYRTRRDTFTKIILQGDGLSRFSWFEVFRKDGRIQRYGNPSIWLTADEIPVAWALDTDADRFGNEVEYLYDAPTVDGHQVELRLAEIRYGGTGVAGSQRVVQFSYGDGSGANADRPDVQHGFFFGAPTEHDRLLESIIAMGSAGAVHSEYKLGYGQDPISGRSRLESVQRCDRFGMCMPPTTLTWKDDGDPGFDTLHAEPPGSEVADMWWEAYGELIGSRQTLIGDFDGDFEQSLLYLTDDGQSSKMFSPQLWHTEEEQSRAIVETGLPVWLRPPPAGSGAVEAMDDWLAGAGSGSIPIHRFQPGLQLAVIDAGPIDRRGDVLVPDAVDNAFGGRDAAGHPIADALLISRPQPWLDATPPEEKLPFSGETIENPSEQWIYSVVPLDHDGDGYSDFWICEGDGYKSGEWTLVLASIEPNDGTAPVVYGFHPSGIGCSVHDELAVASPDGGRRQSLLVVPAYPTDLADQPHPGDPEFSGNIDLYIEDYAPLPEDQRTKYFTLSFEPGSPGKLVDSGLPRDHYQRWHDLLCRNGVADAKGAPPVLSAGLGHDKHIDVNGDGFVDVLRFELAAGDTQAELNAIKKGLGDGAWQTVFPPGVSPPPPPPNLCDGDVDTPVDAVIRVYWNTGAGYTAGPVAHSFDGINAHAAMWLDFVGAQPYDFDADGRLDLLMPSLADGSGFTGLISNGDGSFSVSPSSMPPAGWPAYLGNEAPGEWKDEAERFRKRRIFSVAGDRTFVGPGPDVWFVGVEPSDSLWWTGTAIRRELAPKMLYRERVVEITDGLGALTTFEYGPDDSDPLLDSLGGLFPRRPLRRPRTVVTSHGIQSSPNAELETWSYQYRTGIDDAFEGTFLGYRDVAATLSFPKPEGEVRIERSYDLDYDAALGAYPFSGRPAGTVRLTDLDGDPDNGYEHAVWTERTPTLATESHVGGDTWFTYTGTEVARTLTGTDLCDASTDWADCTGDLADVRMEVTTTRTLDGYGTPTDILVEHRNGDTTSTTNTAIEHDTDNWLLSQVGKSSLSRCPVGAVCPTPRTVTTTFKPVTGAVDTTIVQEGTQDSLTTVFSYDDHGNVSQTAQSDASGEVRTNTWQYDPEGVLLEHQTNAAGHSTWTIVEPTSGATAAVVDPNGLTAVTHFDGFFRPIQTERRASPMGVPDGEPSDITYLAGEPTVPGSAFRVQRDVPGGQRFVEDYGTSGQLVRTRWYGMRESINYGDWLTMPPGDDVVQVHWYDVRGREVLRSLPTLEYQLGPDGHAPHETAFAYDNLDRMVSRVRPDASVDTWEYFYAWGGQISAPPADGAVQTLHTDADSRTDVIITDSHGRVARTVDGLGVETCFQYGAFGVLQRSTVDCGFSGTPRTTTYQYDDLGRLRWENDPTSSAREYDHNGFGDVVLRVDGNGVSSVIDVDSLGRPESITTGTEVETFTWDSTWIGALGSSDSAEGVHRSLYYDAYGRLSQSVTSGFDGANAYAIDYSYDDADRLESIIFPVIVGNPAPVSVGYEYDMSGYLRAIRRPNVNEPLWAALQGHESGQITLEQFGQDTQTVRGYYADTLRPEAIWTFHPTEGDLQRLRYTWTPAGELDHRDDNQYGQTESFLYDDARRLLESTVNLGPEVLTQTVGFDVYGDIEYKSDVGNYDYDANGRLDSYGMPTTSLTYDSNGNVTVRGTQVLTYTPSEKVRTVDGPGVALSFDYDAEGQRVVRHDAANDTTVITLDGMYESRFLAGENHREERYTVPVPTGSAVRIERTVGPPGTFFQERTRYIHSTYLGSGNVVSAPDGTVVAEVAFDPWGQARDATNWTDPVDDATLVELGTGFTGHPAELDGDLVNMGGRMYDPSIARFVQRDPVVADPANGADYNKYSYVRNRPLRLVDPSGYEPAPADDEDDGPSGGEPGPGAGADLGGGFHMDPTDDLFIPIGGRGPYSMGPVFWNGPGQGSGAGEPPPDKGECDGAFMSSSCYEAGAGSANGTKAGGPMDPDWTPMDETGGGMWRVGEIGAYVGAGLTAAAVIGVLILTRGTSVASATESVWGMDKFERGRAIHQALGENLPGNFPVIDSFVNGIATSIKSLDLGAKSYQSAATLTRVVTGYIDKVAGFTGRTWAGVTVRGADITGRALKLAVPAGGGTAAQQTALQAAVEYGESVGVTVSIVPF